MKKLEIIIIDDQMPRTDPFVRQLSKNFPEFDVLNPFETAVEGVNYVISHLDRKIIVFLDCKFETGIQGYDALKKIRDKTSLVYIIMMSSNPLSQMPVDQLSYMINHRGIFFINRNDTKRARELVTKVSHLMDSKLDCMLEQWVLNHDEESLNKPYIRSTKGKTLNLADILVEIRKQTELGKRLERNIMLLAIDLLTRGKRELPDD